MSEIVSSIVLCLFIAALIGLVMGWLLNRIKVIELEENVNRLQRDVARREKANPFEINSNAPNHLMMTELESENSLLRNGQEESAREIQTLRQKLESALAASSRLATELMEHQSGLTNLNALLDSRDSTLLERSSLLRARDEALRNRESRINQLELEVATYKSELDRYRSK